MTMPVLKPLLPTADKLLPYLREIDTNRWYTNHGPLLVRFEKLLAQHFAIDADQLTTSTNGTLAITQTLMAMNAPRDSLCVMPSWTFTATPAAAIWAGLQPYFVDVDPGSWLITPAMVRDVAAKNKVGAVIVVSAFGAPVDAAEWDEFTRSTGIPVLIDAAAGFDGFAEYGKQGATTPVTISFHATKVSGIGEGAAILTRDKDLAQRVRSLGNFGFNGSRNSECAGGNAKMSEYTAAMGLALMDEWPARRAGWAELSNLFIRHARAMPELALAPGFNEGWISSYGLIGLPAEVRADTVSAALTDAGVESRQWWGKGCHRQTAYQDCPRGSLTVTEELGRQTLGLPFWLGMTPEQVEAVFSTLKKALAELKKSQSNVVRLTA